MRSGLQVLALCSALLAAGCSGDGLVEAGGTVKYKNAPIPGADVIFVSEEGGQPSIGRTDEQGRFTLSTGGRTGAPPGSHKVSITAAKNKREVSEAEAVTMSGDQIAANRQDLIPVKYNNLVSSGLSADVTEDPAKNDFTFDLK